MFLKYLKEYNDFVKSKKTEIKDKKRPAKFLSKEELQELMNATIDEPGVWLEVYYPDGTVLKLKRQRLNSFDGSFVNYINGDPTPDELKIGL